MTGIIRVLSVFCFTVVCATFGAALAPSAKLTDFPDCSIPWTGAETKQAATILNSDQVQLLQFSDENGRLILGRMLSRDNLKLYANQEFSLKTRLGDYMQMMQSTSEILQTYLKSDTTRAGKNHQEIAAIQIYIVYVAAAAMGLVDEFLPTIAHDDKYESRMKGLRQMYDGIYTIFSGIIVSSTDKKFFNSQEISAMIAALDETLPIVKPGFTDTSIKQLKTKLVSRLKTLSVKADITAVKHMLANLES